jgi:hypothetical protein
VSVARADLCEAYVPFVFGGVLDEWTYAEPARDLTEWPCPGRTEAKGLPGVFIECVCRCHAGGFEHELPPRRTAVHPTEVLAGG